VRAALGASRWRVVQHGILEQVTLAVLGGALGTALAWWGTNALLARYELPVPRAEAVAVDLRVLAFALGVSILSGVAASVLPSLMEGRVAPGRAMAGRRGTVRGGRNLPGASLVAAEVALAVVLLIAGGLLSRNFLALVGRDLGFNPEGVVTADIALTAERYRAGQEVRLQYWSSALETLAAIPGVTASAAGSPIPTGVGGRGFVLIEEQPEVEAGADYRVVSHDYFDLLQIPLLAGRLFDATDGPTGERVTIINRAMAEAYWPDANPVGERIRATSQESLPEAPSLRIIGVVGDLRQYGFSGDLNTAMYVLHEQVPAYTGGMTLMARTAGDPDAIVSVTRERLRALDNELAVDVATLDARLGGRVAGERLLATTLALFAALGLTLAAIGIYGLLSFAVGQRTREIAVRMAIGARAADVVGMVVRNALVVVAVGLVAGLWLAYGLRNLVAALLADVPAGDPITYVLVVIVVVLTAVSAALLPALRAVRGSPLDALRQA
jgi:predicted permease